MEDLKDICGKFELDDWGYCNWFVNCEKNTCKNNCHLNCDKNINDISR
jgi:hypothetical protein